MTVYEQLAEINKVCDVTKTKIRFSRKGSTKDDTMYMLIPVINEPISPKVLATIEAIPLHSFGRPKSEAKQARVEDFPPDFGDPPPEDNSELPF